MIPTEKLFSDLTNTANLDAMSDHQFIATFEHLAGNKLFDPDASAKILVSEIERRLGGRTLSHRQRYLIIRDRMGKLSKASVGREMAKTDPAYSRFKGLEGKARVLLREIAAILKSIEGYPPTAHQKRKGLKRAESKVAQFEKLQDDMNAIKAVLELSHNRLQEYIDKVQPLWKSLKGADRLILRLKFSLVFVEFQTFSVRLIYLVLMFILAITVDKYLPLMERVFERAGTSQRHPLAVSLLFLIQALLFEPVFVRVKKRMSWNIVRRMAKTARKLLIKVDDFEQRLGESEGELPILEVEISRR